jgi:hypothetical protein
MLKNILKKPFILYSLLKNILVAFLIIWSIALLGESFLPEFVSTQISFLKLTLLIFTLVFSIYLLSQKITIQKSAPKEKSKIVLFISVFLTLIVFGLALLKFDYFANITIILTTLLILFYFYKELLGKE